MVGSSMLTAAARRLGRRTAASELMLAVLGHGAHRACAARLAACRLPRRRAQGDRRLRAGHRRRRLAAKEHDRCGSNLVAPMLISTVAGNLLVRSFSVRAGPVAGAAVTLAGVALSVEMFAWSERHRETRAGTRVSQAGLRDAAAVRHAGAHHGAARSGARGAASRSCAAKLASERTNFLAIPPDRVYAECEPLPLGLGWWIRTLSRVHDGLEQGCFRSQQQACRSRTSSSPGFSLGCRSS